MRLSYGEAETGLNTTFALLIVAIFGVVCLSVFGIVIKRRSKKKGDAKTYESTEMANKF